jgi:iron(III) transport system permease protein
MSSAADQATGQPQRQDARRRFAQARYRLAVVRSDPTRIVGFVLLVPLLYLVVAPLVSVLLDAVTVHLRDAIPAHQPAGSLTSYYLFRIFISPVSKLLFWRPLGNTVVVALGTVAFATIVGGAMAWQLTRTNMAGRKWLATALVVPYMVPSWTFPLAWLSLFKNARASGQVGILQAHGIATPDWLAYGALPMIICLGLHYYPFVLLLFGNALRRLDSQLEDSARILGAGGALIARRITVPLMLPALSSAILLVLGRVLGTFGTPYILGLPTNYSLLSTSLYRSIANSDQGGAAVFTCIIAIIGVVVVLTDLRLMREQRRFVTVGGKGAMSRLVDLGKWRPLAFGCALAVFLAAVVVPLGTLFLSTISEVPGVFSAANFTLKFWLAGHLDGAVGFPHGVLTGGELYQAAWNSIRFVGLASLICGIVGLLVGYVVVRIEGSWLATALRQLSFLPYLIPGMSFAAASLSLFAVQRGPIPALYGTGALLVLVLVVTHLPYSSRAGISAMTQLGREPEEAAQICGAGWLSRLGRVIIPIQRGPLVVGVLLPFISGLKELSIVVMLATTGTQLLTTLSITLIDYAYFQLADAVVLVIALVSFLATYLTQKLTRTSLASGLGG